MARLSVEPYRSQWRDAWDEAVRASRSGHFLFCRGYLEYHADRFVDASLVVLDGGRVAAVLPASRHGERVVSHGGLTFGGLVCGIGMTTSRVMAALDETCRHLHLAGAAVLVYKAVPHIYHRVPGEEDLYALFRHDGRLVRRDVSYALPAGTRPRYSKGRRHAVKSGRSSGLSLARSERWEEFMAIAEEQLRARHGVAPVHTAAEIRLLAERFPDGIKLFAAERGAELLAGVVIYETPMVAHAQYIASTDAGRELNAVDALIDHLLTDVYTAKPWFDFGISTEREGRHLNVGLARNKESFGARAVCYDHYELSLG